jgi:hypothetical protein
MPSDAYAATGAQTTTASPGDTTLAVLAEANHRGFIHDIIFSQSATPADTELQWLVRRLTAVGTEGAGVVPITINDPGGTAAAGLDGAENHTAEPTYTSATEILDFDLNQRATFRWVATPEIGGIVVPATANNGIGVTAISANYSGDTKVTMQWVE